MCSKIAVSAVRCIPGTLPLPLCLARLEEGFHKSQKIPLAAVKQSPEPSADPCKSLDMSPKFLPSFGEVLGFGLMALRCDPVQVYLLCKFQWGHVSQR